MTELEKQFDRAMKDIYITAKRECGYNAIRFLQLVVEKGGRIAAKQLIRKPGGTYGFEALYEYGRLDLTVEAHVLRPEFQPLFTEEERQICKDRLDALGYKPNL